MKPEKSQLTQQVKRVVDQVASAHQVVLFGSRARGDFRKDSDWDFLIIIDQEAFGQEEKEHLRDKLYELELATDSVLNAIIHTRREWEQRAVTPFYEVIQEEGQTL